MEKEKVPLRDARKAAAALLRQLRKFCVRCKVAGSIRRKKAMVSDIEILFIPKSGMEPNPDDLFGHKIPVDYLVEELKFLEARGVLERRKTKKGKENDASLVVSMRDVDNPAPFVGPIEPDGRISQIVSQLKDLRNVNRQVLPHAYTLNGVVYLFRWEALKDRHTFYSDPERSYGFETDPTHCVEIDTELNLAWARSLVAGISRTGCTSFSCSVGSQFG